MNYRGFDSCWTLLVTFVVMTRSLQSTGAEFERLPPVRLEAREAPSLFAPPNDVILQPAKDASQRTWLARNHHRAQFAFGPAAGSVQLSSLVTSPGVPPVLVAEEPAMEPIAIGPASQGEPGHCYWDPCPACRPQPCWVIRADALMLWRTKSRDIKIVELGTGAPPRGQRDALLTTNALEQDPSWGPRVTIDRYIDDRHRFEMSYFGLNHWTSQASFDGANAVGFSFMNIDVPFDSNLFSDFDGGQFVSATYASEIHSVEINIKTSDRWDLNRSTGYPWYEYVDFLGGVRYFRLEEEFDLASTDAGETSNYLIDATNDLIGGQLGLIAGAYVAPTIRWNLVGKAGVYANLAKQSTLLRDDNNTVLFRDLTTRDEELAFIGELNFNVAYDVRPNAALTAGYALIWLDGVALAPEQLDFTTTPTSGSALNQNGGVLFHGLFVGLQVER